MRLSTLEIKGFKSFADKTTLHFNNDITGVVGPNGCGKSNIVDAIRWVLGEQRPTTLRSEKMDNLIFNGTKKRRSSNLAEVTLTFENTKNILPTEYQNVTISRHYYRTGESEYRLNNVPCRLKDITSLFMDTGIGSDSYAIIELKMIEEILSDKENSRRRLFEQAAGIEKYKRRKHETFLKLNATNGDLDRVEDLLYEIEGNLKELEKQAKKTKRYYKLKREYKELSIALAIHLLTGQKDIYATINKQLEAETDKRSKADTEIRKLEAKIEQEKSGNIEKEQLLSAQQKKLNAHISNIQNLENDKNLLREKQRYLKEKITSLDQATAQANQRIKDLEEEQADINGKIAALSIDRDSLKKIVEQLSGQMEVVREQHNEQQPRVTQLKEALIKVQQQLYEKEKLQAILKVRLENLLNEIEKNASLSELNKDQLTSLQKEYATLNKEKAKAEQELKAMREEDETLSEKRETNENILEKLKQELVNENRQLDARRNEYQLTKNLVDNLEGFPDSIKFLKKEAKFTRNAPLVSDIISAKPDYRVAIENYLEHYLNYYVVNNLEEAVYSVNLLNKSSKGRANFILLDQLQSFTPESDFRTDGAKSAMEIVEVDEKYRKLAAWLLQDVYVLDDLENKDAGTVEALLQSEKHTVISKSGKYIKSGHTMSGGSVGLFEGKRLGRAKNLERLEKEIRKLEKKAFEINKQVESLHARQQELKEAAISGPIREKEAQLNEIRQKGAGMLARIENLEAGITHADTTHKGAAAAIEEISTQSGELEKELEILTSERAGLQEKTAREEGILKQINEQLTELSTRFNQENVQYHQLENELQSLRKDLEFRQQQHRETGQTITSNKEGREAAASEISAGTEKMEHLETELAAAYAEKEELEKGVQEAEAQYFQSRSAIHEIEEQVKEWQHTRQQSETLIQELKEKMNDLKLDLASMKERLSIEFNVDINDLLDQELSDEYDHESLQEEVERKKNKLDNFGEINPLAVHAFDEMKERYDFIISQKNDLMEAKENLLETIREIDETATDQFLTAFEKVQGHFEEVFRTLFTEEDSCELKLVDSDNPLESKIEIMAQPKGKRPLTINQLSGGEKSLTAIALLFALYLIKPAPFCIFDEVDAPLDDVNVGKFTEIIRQFSKDSQFIIVTHNKQTMAEVDIIYGVTMIEQGVSRVVPVNFGSLN